MDSTTLGLPEVTLLTTEVATLAGFAVWATDDVAGVPAKLPATVPVDETCCSLFDAMLD